MRYIYPGLSEILIQNLLNRDKEHTQRSTHFSSKVVLQSILAKDVQTWNHIDLMRARSKEMRAEGIITFKGKQNRNILTTEDDLSHFVWPRTLKCKSSLPVYNEWKTLHHQHGPLLELQWDQREKFKGAVNRLDNSVSQ